MCLTWILHTMRANHVLTPAIYLIVGLSLLRVHPANADTIGLHCSNKAGAGYADYVVDLTGRTVSWTATGHRFVVPAQISGASIDWEFDHPGIIKEVNHIDRSTGFMTSVVHYYARTYGSKRPDSYEYQCQKTQGF